MFKWNKEEKPKTYQCSYVNLNNGKRCNNFTTKPPYCWAHTMQGRPGLEIKNERCRAIINNLNTPYNKGKRCLNSTGGHPSGYCFNHRIKLGIEE